MECEVTSVIAACRNKGCTGHRFVVSKGCVQQTDWGCDVAVSEFITRSATEANVHGAFSKLDEGVTIVIQMRSPTIEMKLA